MTDQPGRSDPAGLDDADCLALLELSGDQAAVVAADGAVVWSNGALGRRLGRPGGGPVAASDVHPDDRDVAGRVLTAARRGEAVDGLDVRYRDAAGRMWCWRWRVAPGPPGAPAALLASEPEGAGPGEVDLGRILDHSASAIFAKDLDGRYLLVNAAFARLLGTDARTVVGARTRDLWPEGPADPEERDARVLRTATAETDEEHVTLADGPHTILTSRFPLVDDDGRPCGVAGIATDITDRTRAAAAAGERQALLETILRASPDLVAVLDRTGRVTDLSEAAGELLGLRLPAEGDSWWQLVHPDDLPGLVAAFRRVLETAEGPEPLRYRVRRPDGGWSVLETRGGPVLAADGTVEGAVVVSRDVTAELVVEHQLRQALGDAEAANRAKSDSLSRLSHDLRTPLNSVLGFAQLLALDDLPPAQEEAVEHIVRAGRHLLDLIDEVIDVSKAETGTLDLAVATVPVMGVVADACDLIRPLAEQRGVAVGVEAGPADRAGLAVRADRQRLLQVLLNLLSNAVKYNRPGGHAQVGVEARGRAVAIEVVDTGPGIDPAARARLFEPFDRLGAEGSGVEGTGVGLSLSKQLVEQMGGRLSVESEIGRGSTFTVSLRAAAARPAPAPPSPDAGPTPPTGWLRVLLVEDNADNLALVREVLERRGSVALETATSGAEAVERARHAPPDLILLDVHLPDMDGDAVLDRLDADPATAEIPVAVITADATAAVRQRLRRHRVAAYLTKPIDVRHLLIVVDAARPGVA